MTTRKQRFKDLMRHRTTEDQGLTLSQIFCEIYPELVEKYAGTKQMYDTGQVYTYSDDDEYVGKFGYVRLMIKQVRKTDDEFRWLSVLPVKRNEVDKFGKKVRPYLEYKYINIKASQTPELLERVNRIWAKHAQACLRGLEDKRKRLEDLAERLSTKEGQREAEISGAAFLGELEFKYGDIAETNKIISELKQEGRLPEQYKPDHKNIYKILEREIANRTALTHMMRQMPDVILYDDHKRNEEIRKAVKDIITSTFDAKQFEKEQARNSKKYDWEALDYR